MLDIPPFNDPCWLMDSWRTMKLIQIMKDRNISIREMGRLTGSTDQTVYAWRSNKVRPIPKATLRLVMFECNYGDLQ